MAVRDSECNYDRKIYRHDPQESPCIEIAEIMALVARIQQDPSYKKSEKNEK